MKLTNSILKDRDKNKISYLKMLPSLVASLFSVLFSLSIVFELSNVVNGFVLAFLSVFTLLFLVMNEKIKVEQIKKLYQNKYSALLPFALTFIISLSLSSIGIYLWTNKTMSNTIAVKENTIELGTNIKLKYLDQISKLESNEFESSEQFNVLQQSLIYWKGRSASSIEDRTNIREQIKEIEYNINGQRELFNLKNDKKISAVNMSMDSELSKLKILDSNNLTKINRSDNVSYIFLIMILITELGIIILNGKLSKLQKIEFDFTQSKDASHFMIGRKILESLLLTQNSMNIVNIKNAMCSPVITKLNMPDNKKWDSVKSMYNLFIKLNILDTGKMFGTLLTNKIIVDNKKALEIYDEYYEKFLSL